MQIEKDGTELDHNLYSRQIGAFGVEAMVKLIKLRVLVIGVNGLGIESAKNLILAGPKAVSLWDAARAEEGDREFNFYLRDEHLTNGLSRAECVAKPMAELNSYVDVNVLDLPTFDDLADPKILDNFDLVIVCDFYPLHKMKKLNQILRDMGKGLICAGTAGLLGFVIVDFGEGHKVFDKNGEQNKQVLISAIDVEGVVTTQEDKRHDFEEGDLVRFTEVVGMEGVNGNVFKISKVPTPFTFVVDALKGDNFGSYERNGIAEEVKEVITIVHKPVETVLNANCGDLVDCDFDFENADRVPLLRTLLHHFWQYATQNGIPDFFDMDKYTLYLDSITAASKTDESIVKENWGKLLESDLPKFVFCLAKGTFSPMNSFYGGIVAQEAVKYTGKFTPLNQLFVHEFYTTCFKHIGFDAVLSNKSSLNNNIDKRHVSQIALLGENIQGQIRATNTFLVGAGALGCEYLKMFSLMGLATDETGSVVVTDDDTIEISNLNRQFLFRTSHIGKSKSVTASLVAKEMNPALNVRAMQERVSSETEHIFTDKFWDNLNFIVNAVDNIKAREYVDKKTVFHLKQLFESGTLGTKCNSQMIIPNKTESYSDSQDPQEKGIAMCTLRSFPYLIDHTIEWSRSKFFDLFVQTSKFLKEIFENPEKKVEDLETEIKNNISGLVDLYENLKYFLPLVKNPTIDEALKFARALYQEFFDDKIAELLALFPADYRDKDGNLFWKSPKRPPVPINFDGANSEHVQYIKATLNILNQIFKNRELLITEDNIIESLKDLKISKKKISIKNEDRDRIVNEKASTSNQIDEEAIKALVKEFYVVAKKNEGLQFEEIDFEKDNDANGHIDFITFFANFRAVNYSIPEAPRHKIKMIAGKIVPAIATTTAMVVGAVGIEIYKHYLQVPIEQSRNFFSNLAINIFMFSEPSPVKVNKDKEYDEILLGPMVTVPKNWHTWDRIDIPGGLALEDFMKQIRENYGFNVSSVMSGPLTLMNTYLKPADYRLKMKIEDILEEEGKKKYPGKLYEQLHIAGETDDMVDVFSPYVKYQLE